MTTATQTATVQVTWTNAPIIRMSTNVEMPEYGLAANETFYLARSSKNDGTYYIATWDNDCWMCRCPAHKPCKHMRLINADCHKMADVRKAAEQEKAERAQKKAAELFEQVNAELARVQAPAATTEEVAATAARCPIPNADQVSYFVQLNRRSNALKPVPTPTVRKVSESWLLGHRTSALPGRVA